MIKKEQLDQLAKSDFGKILLEYLNQKILEMSNIVKITTYDELLGKQEAVKILKELFSFLEKARENKPETKKTDYL